VTNIELKNNILVLQNFVWLYYICTELDRWVLTCHINHLQVCPTILYNFIDCNPESFSATEEITCILQIPEVHYRIHKSPSLAPILILAKSPILILSFHIRLGIPCGVFP